MHQENYLFHADAAQAIDFDDCGWGFYLYDLVVTLSELEEVPTYQLLRNTLLEQYSRLRPLPERYEQYLYAFRLLRKLQLLLWIVESREHAAFRDDWQAWARDDLDMLKRCSTRSRRSRNPAPAGRRDARLPHTWSTLV